MGDIGDWDHNRILDNSWDASYFYHEKEEINTESNDDQQMSRVSGIFRDLKTAETIEKMAIAWEHIFYRLPMAEIRKFATVCSLWCSISYKVLRRRWGSQTSFLRLWHSNENHAFNAELHYHEQFLKGQNEEEIVEVPAVQAIVTVCTSAFEDIIITEGINLPSKEEVLFGLANKILITQPHSMAADYGYELTGDQFVMESLCIPKSTHFTTMVFSIPLLRDESELCRTEKVQKCLLNQPEIDDGMKSQTVKAILVLKYLQEDDYVNSFMESTAKGGAEVVGGVFYNVGSNKVQANQCPVAVGLSIAADENVKVQTYGICMNSPEAAQQFNLMSTQCNSYSHGFAIVLSYESPDIVLVDEDENSMWLPPMLLRPPQTKKAMEIFRQHVPYIPLVGMVTEQPLTHLHNKSAKIDHGRGDLDMVFLIVTY